MPENTVADLHACGQSVLHAVVSKLPALSELPLFIGKTILNLSISSCLTFLTTSLCWLIYFRPYILHPRVDSAVLVTFDMATTAPAGNALLYDLSLNITFLNKRGWSNVHFSHLTAGLRYNGTRIGRSDDTLPSFKLKAERGRTVSPVLRGRASNVSATVAEALASERAQGQLNINVRVKTILSYKLFPHKEIYYYEYDCWLQFPPVLGNATTPAVIGGFKCDVAK